MKPVPKSMFTVVRVGLIAVVLTACGLSTHYPIPSGPMTTLIPGWERHFMLEWPVEPEHGGSRRLAGYILNRYVEYAPDVRLLVKAPYASGGAVDQRTVWSPTVTAAYRPADSCS